MARDHGLLGGGASSLESTGDQSNQGPGSFLHSGVFLRLCLCAIDLIIVEFTTYNYATKAVQHSSAWLPLPIETPSACTGTLPRSTLHPCLHRPRTHYHVPRARN